jgi:phosphoribosylglycinamide formyltransferase-1
MHETRLAILASHNGATLQAILDAYETGALAMRPVVVIANNSQSGVAPRAKRHSIPLCHLSGKTHPAPEALDRAISQTLEHHAANLVLLAGYMKKLGPCTLTRFGGRVLNTHPALLPKFGGRGMYGARVHAAVLASGEAITGVSIHLVEAEYDKGALLAQCEVPVMAKDTVETLACRVQGARTKISRGSASGHYDRPPPVARHLMDTDRLLSAAVTSSDAVGMNPNPPMFGRRTNLAQVSLFNCRLKTKCTRH